MTVCKCVSILWQNLS